MAIQYLGTSISGLAGDTKPTLTANELGVIFVETDTDKIYQWDGDSWNLTTAADATTAAKGVASFNSDNFAVSSGVVTIKDGGVILGTETTGNYAATIAGTANQIAASASTGAITLSIPNNPTLPGNVTVSGNFTVSGDTTTVNTATLAVEDPLISLATGNTSSDAIDIGIYGLYDTSGSQDLYGGLFRDANDSGKWKLFKDLQAAPTTTVNVSGTGYATGTLVANLEGNITGTAPAGTLTGNTLASGVTASSLTSVGTLTDLTVSGTSTTIGTVTSGVWNAGAVTSSGTITGTTLDISDNATIGDTTDTADRTLTISSDDGYASAVIFGNNGDADRAWWKYYGSDDSPADQMELKVTGSAHSRYQVASNVATVAFQASSGAELSTTAGNITLNAAGGNVYIQDHLKPQADDTYDLGSTGYAWRNLHLEGDITMQDAGKIATSAGDLTIEVAGNNVVVKGTGSAASFLDLDSVSGHNSRLRFYNGGTAKWNLGNDVSGSNAFTIYNQTASQTAILIDASNNTTFSGNVSLGDSDVLNFGASDDLKIYHDASNSYIKEEGTGSLLIWSTGTEVKFLGGTGAETMVDMNVDGSVDLYHNNVKKFETTATGVTVTGDNLTLDTSNGAGWIYMKGQSGNDIGMAWTFSTAADKYASIRMDHTSRATTGLQYHTTYYPMTFDVGASETSTDFAVFNVNQSEIMRLTKTAVGIGTSNPSYTLHVEGGASTRSFTKSTTGDAMIHVDAANDAYIIMGRAGTGKWAMTNNVTTGTDTWSLYDYPNDAHRMAVTTAGNVGIGVSDPDTKLEVAGQVKITGGSPGADKVLTSDADGLATWEDAGGGGGANVARAMAMVFTV